VKTAGRFYSSYCVAAAVVINEQVMDRIAKNGSTRGIVDDTVTHEPFVGHTSGSAITATCAVIVVIILNAAVAVKLVPAVSVSVSRRRHTCLCL
jgi:hypothetical protein